MRAGAGPVGALCAVATGLVSAFDAARLSVFQPAYSTLDDAATGAVRMRIFDFSFNVIFSVRTYAPRIL